MKKFLLLAMCILLIIPVVACSNKDAQTSAKKDESWEHIEKKKKITIGLCAAYPPFESRNEKSGQIEGFDIDLAKAIGKEIGIEVEIKDAEWQALLGGLNKGDYDALVTCMSKREAAKENVNMSDIYYVLNDSIVVRDDNNSIKSAKDLKGSIVGVQIGSGSEQVVDKMQGLKEVKRYNYNPEAFIDLKNKRNDAVVVGYAYAVNQLKQEKGFRLLDDKLEPADIVVVMRHGEDALTGKINEGLKKIKENGTYDKIVKKWLSVN
ncbi:MAG: transporter substrate-binding domain-containing protein [Clostridium sp.]